jgi:hypothetical protein
MKLRSVFTTAVSTFVVATVAALGFSSQAQGLTFSGSSSGQWGIPTPGSDNPNAFYTGVGTNLFTWGQPEPNDPNYGTPPNQLTFAGNSFSTETNSLFKVGELEYYNGTVPEFTNVDSVPLNLRVAFQDPVNISKVFDFDFDLVNTPNISSNPEENADYISVNKKFSDQSFIFDGLQYTLELTGFSQDGGQTNVSQFRVLENQRTTAALFARIIRVRVPEKIPEPTTIVGLGVLGIYFISRRSSLKVKNQK